MNNRLNVLLERLPSQFTVEQDSANYKLLSLIAEGSKENRAIYDTILKFWDVDMAEGVGLDRLGKDEGIRRGSMDDEEYRKMIKIQCILNMSDGDIPTINLILDAYMGDKFIGVQDAFTELDLPATLLANVGQYVGGLPSGLSHRIKAAGVALYWISRFAEEQLTLSHYSYIYPVLYPIAGYHWTEGIKGMALESTVQVGSEPYRYPVLYPVANDFETDGVKGLAFEDAGAQLTQIIGAGVNPYPVCGEFYGGG